MWVASGSKPDDGDAKCLRLREPALNADAVETPRSGGNRTLLSADRNNAAGIATLMEHANNFRRTIGDAIEDRVGTHGSGVNSLDQFGAFAPRMGVLDYNFYSGINFRQESVGDFGRRQLGKIDPYVDEVLLRGRRPENVNFGTHVRDGREL